MRSSLVWLQDGHFISHFSFHFIPFYLFLPLLFFSFSILSLLRLPSFPSLGEEKRLVVRHSFPIFILQGYNLFGFYWGAFSLRLFGFYKFFFTMSPFCFVVKVVFCVFKGSSRLLQKKSGFRVLGWAHRIGVCVVKGLARAIVFLPLVLHFLLSCEGDWRRWDWIGVFVELGTFLRVLFVLFSSFSFDFPLVYCV